MNTPAPVVMTPQMIALLAKSKKVMNKSLEDKPITVKNAAPALSESHKYDSTPIYSESDEREPNYNDYAPRPAAIAPPENFSVEHIMASGLPANVKEAMIKNPIARPSMTGVLTQDIIEAINPNARRATPAPAPRQIVNEAARPAQYNDSDLITISRSELKEMMNETLVNFLKTNYEKNLTESAITRTINLLIKEGKINVKKKTV
jgi:hypothetical protein